MSGIQAPKTSVTTGPVPGTKPLEHPRRSVTPGVHRPSSAAHSRRAHQADRVETKPTAQSNPAAVPAPAKEAVSPEAAQANARAQDGMFGVVEEAQTPHAEVAEQNASGFFSEASKLFNPETRHQVNYGVMLKSLVTFAVDVFYHPLLKEVPPTSKLGQMGAIARTLAEHHHLDHAKVTELVDKGAQLYQQHHRYAQSMKAPDAKADEAVEKDIHSQAGSLLSALGDAAKALFVVHQQVRAANAQPVAGAAPQGTQAAARTSDQTETPAQTQPAATPATKPAKSEFSFTVDDRNSHALHQLSTQTLQRAIRGKTRHPSEGLALSFTDPKTGTRETVRVEKDLELGKLLRFQESHPDLKVDVALDVGIRAPREGQRSLYGKGKDPLREHYEPVAQGISLKELVDPAKLGKLQQAALQVVERKSPKPLPAR